MTDCSMSYMKSIAGSELVKEIIRTELIEEDVIDSFKRLGSLITFDYMSCDRTMFKFSLYHDSNFQHSHHQQVVPQEEPQKLQQTSRLYLKVKKGSLLTFIWNVFARFDDEYILSVKDDKNNLLLEEGRPLWQMKGIDVFNQKLSEGSVNWKYMQQLYEQVKLPSVGVYAFAKMLGKLLITLPLYSSVRQYVVPMPVSFMYNCLLVVHSCPLVVSLPQASKKTAYIQPLIQFFTGKNNGAAVVLDHYYPFWNKMTSKPELCSLFTVHQGHVPIGKPHSYRDVLVRVVELMEHPLGIQNMIGVVEVVNKQQWISTVRYVTLDVFLLRNVIGSSSEIGSSYQTIPILNEVEWQEKCINYRKMHSYPKEISDTFSMDRLHNNDLVNFRNTASWGATEPSQ